MDTNGRDHKCQSSILSIAISPGIRNLIIISLKNLRSRGRRHCVPPTPTSRAAHRGPRSRAITSRISDGDRDPPAARDDAFRGAGKPAYQVFTWRRRSITRRDALPQFIRRTNVFPHPDYTPRLGMIVGSAAWGTSPHRGMTASRIRPSARAIGIRDC